MSEQLKQELEADTDRLETGTVAGSETIGEHEEKPTEGKLEAQKGDESKENTSSQISFPLSSCLPVLTEPTLKMSPLFSPRSTGTSSTWNL